MSASLPWYVLIDDQLFGFGCVLVKFNTFAEATQFGGSYTTTDPNAGNFPVVQFNADPLTVDVYVPKYDASLLTGSVVYARLLISTKAEPAKLAIAGPFPNHDEVDAYVNQLRGLGNSVDSRIVSYEQFTGPMLATADDIDQIHSIGESLFVMPEDKRPLYSVMHNRFTNVPLTIHR